jgi:hypothetical protein
MASEWVGIERVENGIEWALAVEGCVGNRQGKIGRASAREKKRIEEWPKISSHRGERKIASGMGQRNVSSE